MSRMLVVLVRLLPLLAVLVSSSASSSSSSLVDYHGSSVLRCQLGRDAQSRMFPDMLSHEMFLDIWAVHRDFFDVRVNGQQAAILSKMMRCETYIADVGDLLDEEDARLRLSRERWLGAKKAAKTSNNNNNNNNANPDTDSYYETYHQFDEIMEKVADLAREYPDLLEVGRFGSSIEGREMSVVHIGGNSTAKPVIFVQAGIHAREWISSATATYLINALAYNYGIDADTTRLMDAIEFVIVPHINPDGFEYTWTNDRLWRKNRNDNGGHQCKGVDLNRNYDVYWGDASSNECAEDYQGESPASEIEVQNSQNYLNSLSRRIGAIDLHSYGQYIMRPYGYTRALHPEEDIIQELGQGVVDAIYDVHGEQYDNIRSAELYPVTGASDDWFTVELGLWGFCWELRDRGRYGFRLPEDQILPTGQEIFRGLLAFADFVLDNFDPVTAH